MPHSCAYLSNCLLLPVTFLSDSMAVQCSPAIKLCGNASAKSLEQFFVKLRPLEIAVSNLASFNIKLNGIF